MITKPNVNKMIKQLNSQQSATSTTSGFGGTYSPQREQLHIHVLCQGWMYKRGQGGLFSSKKFRKRVSTVCCGGCGLGLWLCWLLFGCQSVHTNTNFLVSNTHTTTPHSTSSWTASPTACSTFFPTNTPTCSSKPNASNNLATWPRGTLI